MSLRASFDILTRGNIHIYYVAINIKWLKCAEELACRYHMISAHRYHMISAHLLDIAHLLGCLLILLLHYVAFDDVVMQWRRAKSCHAHWQDSHFSYWNSVLKVRNPGKRNKYLLLYYKRVITLILVNIVPRWDIEARSQARVLRYPNEG